MRSIFLLSFLLVLLSFTSVKKEFTPPGTVKYNDTLFADDCEISNFLWREYEHWTKEKYGVNSSEYIVTLPDTLIWLEDNNHNEPYACYYHWHPAYKDYPVVGVTYEQVLSFCKWRSKKVNERNSKSGKYKDVKIEYRLPTKYEWEMLSYDLNKIFLTDGWDEKGKRQVNTCWMKDTSDARKHGDEVYPDVFAPVCSYKPSKLGLFNMIGNVSEMVIEKGISKGGGWRHQLKHFSIEKNIEYTKPTAWLGFRCVCVVKKN